MPEGLNRTGDFRNGNPVTLPKNFGTPITTGSSETAHPGNVVDWVPNPAEFGNPVDWKPSPSHFGNPLTNG